MGKSGIGQGPVPVCRKGDNVRGTRMKPVRWGILSTAKIGVEKVIPGMLKSKDIEIVALASRHKARATNTAAALGIPKAYGSYEELLACF